MQHTRTITKKQNPAQALSALQFQQFIAIFGTFATGVSALTGGLGSALNLYTQAIERGLNVYEDKKGELPSAP